MKKVELLAGKEEKNDKSSFIMGGDTMQRESVFGKYVDAEMLSQLKRLAVDPCDSRVSRDSIRPLWNQTLRLRKVMTLSHTECPRRKRKLHQFVKDKIVASAALASKVSSSSSTQENPTKLSRGQLSHASSLSCLLNTTVDSVQTFDHKTLLNSSSSNSLLTFENNNLHSKQISSGFLYLDISPLIDSDESVNGSNPLTPQKPNHHESPSLSPECCDSNRSSNSRKKKPKESYLQARRRSTRLQNFIGDHLQRLTVPIGPRFQADVPEYLNLKYTESENSKWLGTQIWPIDSRKTRSNTRKIGKGRPNSCSCGSSLSTTDCIKRHVLEESRSLMSDLGPAFFNWKFDEMGEAVSKTWTLKDQKSFEALVKKCSPSDGKNLLRNALRCFPRKCGKSIVSYYLNVYVPRRIRSQTSSNVIQVDSDNDEVENVEDGTDNGAKDVKSRYLRQCR